MVKMRQKTEISLEFEEALTIRTGRAFEASCLRCRRQVLMLPANEAAIVTGQSAREIYRQVEAGALHSLEDRSGMLYVCSESLEKIT